ncbi:MAG: hypothetical protein ACR2FS_00405 [Phormidesmis sp.]
MTISPGHTLESASAGERYRSVCTAQRCGGHQANKNGDRSRSFRLVVRWYSRPGRASVPPPVFAWEETRAVRSPRRRECYSMASTVGRIEYIERKEIDSLRGILMHRKLFFMVFLLLVIPYSSRAQSDDFIELSFDSPIGNVTWSPTGAKIAFTTDKTLQIYDRIDQTLQTIGLNHGDGLFRIDQLIWSETEQYIAVLSQSDQSVGLTVAVDLHIYLVEDGSLLLDFSEALPNGQYIFGSIRALC